MSGRRADKVDEGVIREGGEGRDVPVLEQYQGVCQKATTQGVLVRLTLCRSCLSHTCCGDISKYSNDSESRAMKWMLP